MNPNGSLSFIVSLSLTVQFAFKTIILPPKTFKLFQSVETFQTQEDKGLYPQHRGGLMVLLVLK